MIKNMRLLILFAIVLLVSVSIILPAVMKRSGVEVTAVGVGNKCSDIKVGDIITQINDARIESSLDFNNVVKNLAKGALATMIVNNGPGNCAAVGDGDVGLSVKDLPSSSLKFGLELGGGVSNIYSVADSKTLEKTVGVVKERAELSGLSEVKVSPFVGGDKSYLKISGVSDDGFDALVIDGKFTAKISQNVEIKDSVGKLVVGDRTRSVKYGERISVDDVERVVGDKFLLDGIEFSVTNSSNKTVSFDAVIFSNEDVSSVYSTASYVTYQTSVSQYELYVPVKISAAAANRFANVTKRMNTKIVSSDNILLDGELVYWLDGEKVSSLPISFESAGKSMETLAIIGFYKSDKSANSEKMKIETVLQSGSLPSNIKFSSSERYVGSLETIKNYIPFAALGCLIFVIIISWPKCKSWKGILYSTFITICEIIFVVGLISAVQKLGYNWFIDVGTLVGLFLIIFIGYLDSYMKISKKQKLLVKICLFSAGFLSLFTVWRGFGMAVVSVLTIKMVLTDRMRLVEVRA